jgi:hypothetical protein
MLSLFGCLLFNFSLHLIPTLYVNMLEENEVDIHSAPLDSFDQDYDAEEVDKATFDVS